MLSLAGVSRRRRQPGYGAIAETGGENNINQ